ncbi:glycoside hydrolase 43 family protein [Halalkalibacter sp. APA_J-10(15)]|uniref:glycoside hydrolase family 43 protein n=1 Tax=unclassified Halalkalibacter TaxID=2893063 RepID=UPI001FF2297D|nr:glycoside hydrolase 43 family protein [Halalkalibacter sp. APA_J-10(15)]MCK0472262.1 glycoside hydrolase 43 family protein [Halalkalibacter sp. APA_J-10(15)]
MTKTMIRNPIYWADIPDVDVIRVDSVYYMVSTSMHTVPGCPIMKSENLADWEIVGYVFDTLEDNDAHCLLDEKGIYGQGSWAASLRHHNGTFYVCFSSNDMNQFYIYQTKDIEKGEWERSTIEGIYHDPALLLDEERVYVIYGCGDIRMTELTEDVKAVKEGGVNELLLETEKEGIGLRCEGCHAYKLNGYYYLLFIEWPTGGNQRRRQIAYRSKELLGEYERKVILDDDMGYFNKGIAQGAIFDTPTNEWFAMLFQDHDAVGRIPYILPVSWEDDWPMIGIDGKAPEEFEIDLQTTTMKKPLVISDEFFYEDNELALNWQWNHNPDHDKWSVKKRPGYLRLETCQLVSSVLQARNTLTQRTEGPKCSASIKLELAHMEAGDHAGMVALQSHFGTVGVKALGRNDYRVVMTMNEDGHNEREIENIPYEQEVIDLKVDFNFIDSQDLATFYYSYNGQEWNQIGEPLRMKYTLDHFMGYRIGIFNYPTKRTGGYVDVDYFHYEKIKR